MNTLSEILKHYDAFSEKSIRNRFFKHDDIIGLLHALKHPGFEIEHIGNSYEGRSINLINPLTCGNPADFILQDGVATILSVEKGRITAKNF